MAATYQFLIKYGSIDALRTAMGKDPELRAAVQAELAEVRTLRHPERCVITKEYRDALEEALRP